LSHEPTIDDIAALVQALDEARNAEELDAAILVYRQVVTPKVVGDLCAMVRALSGNA
jgi:hypothetical protein